MDDARKIENLLYKYAERIDSGDFEGIAELFSRGKIMSGGPDAPAEATLEGYDAVLGMYQNSTRLYEDGGTPKTKHVTTNVIVEVDDGGKTASARSYYTVFQRTDSLPLQPIITGHYHDTFKCTDGEWHFDTRIMFMDQLGDLSQHLLGDLGSLGQ